MEELSTLPARESHNGTTQHAHMERIAGDYCTVVEFPIQAMQYTLGKSTHDTPSFGKRGTAEEKERKKSEPAPVNWQKSHHLSLSAHG